MRRTPRMSHLSRLTRLASLLGAWLALVFLVGCGYSLNSTPYSLDLRGETLRLSIPVAENRSRYGYLGPALTKAVIERL
ncbi:MAG: hypothetical protein LBS44_05180, partial [Deltaproteobacteria bacterium]|nr:hypothetical protein [Deltaproteobacteria bacterium]